MSEPLETTVKALFDGWPENQADVSGEFTGRIAKNVYPDRKRGELPICLLKEETGLDEKPAVRCYFPNRRGEFVIAERNDQGQLLAYSPKISLFAKHPKKDPNDAYFIVSTGNLKATLHKNSGHVKINRDRVIHCHYPPIDSITPTPILRIYFPSFGLTGSAPIPKVKDGRPTHHISRPPKGQSIVLDFCLHRLPMYEYYYNADPKILAVTTDYRRYVLAATVAFTDTTKEWPRGLKNELFDRIRQHGMNTYKGMLKAKAEQVGCIFACSGAETTDPLVLLSVNNPRELVQEAFS